MVVFRDFPVVSGPTCARKSISIVDKVSHELSQNTSCSSSEVINKVNLQGMYNKKTRGFGGGAMGARRESKKKNIQGSSDKADRRHPEA